MRTRYGDEFDLFTGRKADSTAERAMSMLRRLQVFAAEMVATSPRKVMLSIALTAGLSLTEGVSLVLLMPLLGLVGVGQGNNMPSVLRWFEAGLATVGMKRTLGGVLILFVAIAGFRAILQRWQAGISAGMREDFAAAMRIRVHRAVLGAELKFLVSRRPSEFVHALTGEIERLGAAAYQIIDLTVVATVSFVYLCLAFRLSWIISAVVLSCAGALAWAVRSTMAAARASGNRSATARRNLHAAIAEHVAGMKTAKSYGVADRHAELFIRLCDDLRDVNLKVTAGETNLQQTLEFGSTVLLAVLVYVSFEILRAPAAQLLLLLFIFARLMPRLVTIYRQVYTVGCNLPVFDAVRRLERECREAAEPAMIGGDLAFARRIRFEGVSYIYSGRAGVAALGGVDLEIPAGFTTAIVGPSGAGKSTFADLLTGLLFPATGRILVDGELLTMDRLAGWRRHISYVSQETFLFHDTVRANLRWACPAATDEELWQSLRLSAAADFIRALPQGLDTMIGERGVLLSAGERQRLSLARAMLRQPSILVLDEATSSLDSENELRIQRALEGLHHRMTIVIITHRLSTVRHADIIHVLDSGKLVQSGRWDELWRSRRDRFRQLCLAQGITDEILSCVRQPDTVDRSTHSTTLSQR